MEGKRSQESWRWEAKHDKARPTIAIKPGKEGTSRPGRTFGFGRVLDQKETSDKSSNERGPSDSDEDV